MNKASPLVKRRWLPHSFTAQLLGYAVLLLLAMLAVAAGLSYLAARPSAEHMARTLTVVSRATEQALELRPHAASKLPAELIDAGVFAVLPPASTQIHSDLPFPQALREILQQRLDRPVQFVALANGETALWLPSNEPAQLPFGIRFEPARGPVARSGMRVIAASAIVLLLAAWWLARWLSRPLRRLSLALPGLAAGASPPDLGRHAPEEIRTLAHALAEAMARLREQSLAREQTLAGISHDLRTPLMRITIAAQMLPEHPHVTQIQADIAEMDQLIGDALELARAGRDEPAEMVVVTELVQRLVANQADSWRIQIDPSLRLRVPPIALRRALDNLIQNARRHGCAPFAIEAKREPDRVCLIVADSGYGLGELSADDALLPFRQGGGSAHGSGLGLAIVDRLAASFDAKLSLENDSAGFRAVLSIPASRCEKRAGATQTA